MEDEQEQQGEQSSITATPPQSPSRSTRAVTATTSATTTASNHLNCGILDTVTASASTVSSDDGEHPSCAEFISQQLNNISGSSNIPQQRVVTAEEEAAAAAAAAAAEEEEASFQDAVAVTAALVGETVVDSPRQTSAISQKKITQRVTSLSAAEILGTPDLDRFRAQVNNCHLGPPSNSLEADSASTASNKSKNAPPAYYGAPATTALQPPPPPLSTDNASAVSVGIMAQGLAWARGQRERRKRLYLQNQAQQQMLKISRAQQQEQQQEQRNQMRGGRSLLDNSTFRNMIQSSSMTSTSTAANCHPALLMADSNSSYNKNARSIHKSFSNGSAGSSSHHYHSSSGDDSYCDTKNCGGGSTGFEASISKSGDGISMVLHDHTAAAAADGTTTTANIDDNTQQLAPSHDEIDDDDSAWIPPVRVEDADDENFDDNSLMDGSYNSHSTSHHTTAGLATNPYLLTADQMQQIACRILPRGIAYCRWKRLYSLARDGDSFDNCLGRISAHRQTLLVVRTTRNAVFGAYADSVWEPHYQGGASYFGSANACLFKVVRQPQSPSNSTQSPPQTSPQTSPPTSPNQGSTATATTSTNYGNDVKAFHWSGANRYFQLCDPSHKRLALGGGDGSFGLCVEQDFQKGSTGQCATFGNEPLCGQENFSIVDMEVYGFLVGQF